MNQILSNLTSSPSIVITAFLWLVWVILSIKICRKWAKETKKEKIIIKNHESIAEKEYEFSGLSTLNESRAALKSNNAMISKPARIKHLASLPNAWDL